ncbi:helix-turn-helix transcriptional regulator [Gluconacetobacter diazotrophicus]|uniref:Helix-turn-helix transcriptional regulator n=2 Tax=Gluconacetobacter diazotrophicus TaxID=33996 RepID=A0A7W4I7V7_GLUDI|nr:helix-turn-helix transcriptional regulator [Gluconacetobacter diazotrophicus]
MIARHPKREDIRLEAVLTALGNPIRLAAVRTIAVGGEHPCCDVLPQIPKSTMTHHWRALRDSGVVWQRHIGREYRLELRREDLDSRFPGLLDSILGPLVSDPLTQETVSEYDRSRQGAPA